MLINYSPLMSEATEMGLEKVIKIGAAFSEVSSSSTLPYRNYQDNDML